VKTNETEEKIEKI